MKAIVNMDAEKKNDTWYQMKCSSASASHKVFINYVTSFFTTDLENIIIIENKRS